MMRVAARLSPVISNLMAYARLQRTTDCSLVHHDNWPISTTRTRTNWSNTISATGKKCALPPTTSLNTLAWAYPKSVLRSAGAGFRNHNGWLSRTLTMAGSYDGYCG
jgi:hypothetical protein